ncbi:stearoyl-CoA desaturase (delta-9 desaturase) [Actinocorallia herbida]|uniref:Stearoyl-CoA desaturase (Delta-9 desaturase) n=1 Tax=Actinocorallia herbida TaxID=58109 RepID=A0A3N1DBC8_9ACTN|nr:fatty acid desaturase [Actinocorallia herbida]ROO90820.1 stearoyl-CoA desaturase (delta-9 desaturase) [Actinocorallia herbida]
MDGRQHRLFILAVSLVPLLGVAVAMVLLWNRAFGVSDVVSLVVMYAIGGIGISTGFHRMLSHRSFKSGRAVQDVLAVAGTIAGQGPAIIWAAHHRRHHRVADRDGDPHSPYAGGEGSRRAILKGLWHAHLGWLFDEELTSDPVRYCPDLVRDRHLRWISEHFVGIVVAGLAAPALIGFAVSGGEPMAALTGFVWGGLVRLFLLSHFTYAVNSLGHFHGRRRFSTPDESRNIGWLAVPSFGDSWHNNHHAFPRAAGHGMRWYEIDPSAWLIKGLAALGLVWDVIEIDKDRQDQRAAGLARIGGGRHARNEPPVPLAEMPRRGRRPAADAADIE